MYHHPILIERVSLSFPHKTCFESFSGQISFGDRIAIIGRNGSGKTSLLQLILNERAPDEGQLIYPSDIKMGYVSQVVTEHSSLSGGQRFNKLLTQVLGVNPNILILDEPTNHLDLQNRKSLVKLLHNYKGTLLVVTHDTKLLKSLFNKFWLIENGKIREFLGHYDDLRIDLDVKREKALRDYDNLEQQRKVAHKSLMKEQERAKKSRLRGEKHIEGRKWPTIVSNEKARRANETSGKKKHAIRDKKDEVSEQLRILRPQEVITPQFSISYSRSKKQTLVSIINGSVGYQENERSSILSSINISVGAHERVAIIGENGSGKTTFLKSLLRNPHIYTDGEWKTLPPDSIGYLDQSYQNLKHEKSAMELLHETAPGWDSLQLRRHLNNFLLRKNEEVFIKTAHLSGGERVRLSLALIAAKAPHLLILDEITNNLDLETKEHVLNVINSYPGAMVIVSHEEEFLKGIDNLNRYEIVNNTLLRKS